MTPEEQDVIKSVGVFAGAIGVVAGAWVTSIFVLLNGWRQRVAESRRHKLEIDAANARHLRELALEAAIADWKRCLGEAERWRPANALQSEAHRPVVDPLDYFLVKKLKMVQTFGSATIDIEDLSEKWKDMAEFNRRFSTLGGRRDTSSKESKTSEKTPMESMPVV